MLLRPSSWPCPWQRGRPVHLCVFQLAPRVGTQSLDNTAQLCDLAHPCSFSAVHKAQVPYNLQFSTSVRAQAEVAMAKHSAMGHKNHETQRCVRRRHMGRARSGRAHNDSDRHSRISTRRVGLFRTWAKEGHAP